jgi:hypothetical protein
MHLFKNTSNTKLIEDKNKTKFKVQRTILYIIFICSLVSINLVASTLIKLISLPTFNASPNWLFFGDWGKFLLLIFVVLAWNYIRPKTIITCLILGGIISNTLEFYIFGFVADYINLGIGVLNLADLQIYSGLIWLTALTLRYKLNSVNYT